MYNEKNNYYANVKKFCIQFNVWLIFTTHSQKHTHTHNHKHFYSLGKLRLKKKQAHLFVRNENEENFAFFAWKFNGKWKSNRKWAKLKRCLFNEHRSYIRKPIVYCLEQRHEREKLSFSSAQTESHEVSANEKRPNFKWTTTWKAFFVAFCGTKCILIPSSHSIFFLFCL